jgi:polysaccharide biosynthesis protein PelD
MTHSDWRNVYVEQKTSVAISETLALTLLGIMLGYFFMPESAYFSAPGFSWLIVGPALSGLRYGLIYAISSVFILIIVALIGHLYQFSWAQGLPVGLGLSLLFTAVVAGEFRSYWHRRIKRLNAAALYLNERLSEVSHAFNMLKHSHDHLEQLVATRVSLRDSISSIRRQILLSHTDKEDLEGLGLLILRSLADFGSLQGASLHAMDQQSNNVAPRPIAYIGNPVALDMNNQILLKSIATRKTVSLKIEFINQKDNKLLVSIPLIDVYDKFYGVIVVNKMPFRAFREDNIQLLSILGGYIGDLLSTKKQTGKTIKDADIVYFYIQAMRCLQDVINYNLSASLLGFEFKNHLYADKLIRLITPRQRGLDQFLLLKNRQGRQVLLFILPLTDQRGIDGYLAKLHNIFKTEFNPAELKELGFHHALQILSAQKSIDTSIQLISDELSLDNVFN